jgi:hypothetical protein
MWLLHFLPDSFLAFVVNAVLVLGVLSTILTFFVINPLLRWFPPLSKYVTLAQIASLVVLTAGVYFKGGYSTEMMWRERVREMEAKVAQAEAESREANTALEKKSAEKVKVIKGREVVVKQYIDREVAKYNDKCDIPSAFVNAHNQSAEPPKK